MEPEDDSPAYTAVFRVTGKYVVTDIRKDTPSEALKTANEMFSEADFGELKDVDGKCVYIEY